ncbi:MAG: hypothetical protein WC520_00180 [Candidatus Paceibacterota bacterium]
MNDQINPSGGKTKSLIKTKYIFLFILLFSLCALYFSYLLLMRISEEKFFTAIFGVFIAGDFFAIWLVMSSMNKQINNGSVLKATLKDLLISIVIFGIFIVLINKYIYAYYSLIGV